MKNKIKILPGLLLCFIFLSEKIHSQSNQPQSTSYKMEFSAFMSSGIKAGNGNTSIVGLLGDPFLKGGSSQSFSFIDNVFFADFVITDLRDNFDSGIPEEYELLQNYPNPFNPSTTIKFSLPDEGFVNLTVYNIIGQAVIELVNEHRRAGYYEVKFNANNLSSGFYIYRITSGNFSATKKMLLIK